MQLDINQLKELDSRSDGRGLDAAGGVVTVSVGIVSHGQSPFKVVVNSNFACK